MAYPQLYQRVVSYTSSRVLYNAMSVSGATLTISGYTHSLGDLGRYLQMMYTEPDASAISLTTGIPGPDFAESGHAANYSRFPAGVTAKLARLPSPDYLLHGPKRPNR